MNDRVYISTLALGRDWIATVRQGGKLPEGLQLELGGGVGRDDALWLLDEAKRHFARGAKSAFLLHNYFPPPADPFVINLASSDTEVRNRTIEFCRSAMRVCKAIGSPFYSVHAGMTVDPSPEQLGRPFQGAVPISMMEATELFKASVATLVEDAKVLGIRLLLENHVLAGFNASDRRNRLLLLCGIEDFESFDRSFPWSEVGILLDVGHLKVSSTTLGFDPRKAVDAVRHRIGAVHLHDNDSLQDMHQAFGKDAWFIDLLPSLPSDAVYIIESGRSSDEAIAQMHKILKTAA